MGLDLFLKIDYGIEIDKFHHCTNIKEECVSDIVSDFLCGQIGAGVDDSKANDQDIYEIDIFEIDIFVNFADDSFACRHNCGNKGLREGILMRFLNKLSKS
ncbi:hypothetical protein KKB69_01290 [Patescibacteria group bacterium]|nr:hypothetical protein [Patescibacteria group bacterium]